MFNTLRFIYLRLASLPKQEKNEFILFKTIIVLTQNRIL